MKIFSSFASSYFEEIHIITYRISKLHSFFILFLSLSPPLSCVGSGFPCNQAKPNAILFCFHRAHGHIVYIRYILFPFFPPNTIWIKCKLFMFHVHEFGSCIFIVGTLINLQNASPLKWFYLHFEIECTLHIFENVAFGICDECICPMPTGGICIAHSSHTAYEYVYFSMDLCFNALFEWIVLLSK